VTSSTRLRSWFEDLEKQTHAARLGMWAFIASEALLFTGLFALYAGYRTTYPQAFGEAAAHTDLVLGSAMTFVLVTSSFAVAVGLGGVRENRPRWTMPSLLTAIVLGFVFLGLKATEYAEHFRHGIFPGHYYRFAELSEPGARIFFTLYYVMTGLHALHVIGGIALLAALAWSTHRGRWTAGYHTPLELGGMYWHFVDVVWLFLWPLFYLLR